MQSLTEFEVVDGQQRITTLFLLLLAIYQSGKEPLRDKYIKSGDWYRLELGILNNSFLHSLVDGTAQVADCKSNRLLAGCLDYFTRQLKASRQDPNEIIEYIQGYTFSLEFQVSDENLAIKAFESLNDRGKPLTLLDKTKSFLMFESSRYHSGELSGLINECFGNVFKKYDLIKEKGEKGRIEFIKNPRYRFTEDELLRFFYHYFALHAIKKYKPGEITSYNYYVTTENVFEEFLKGVCGELKKTPSRLRSFIKGFLQDFQAYTESFLAVVSRVETDDKYERLFSFLNLSAAVYPLVISLEKEGLLSERILAAIEALDLRVYKIRGTDPRADLYKHTLAKIKDKKDSNLAYQGISDFIDRFMRDAELQSYLSGNMYRNPATKYILWEYEKSKSSDLDNCEHSFYASLEKEHVFAESEMIAFPAFGFQNEGEYMDNINRLGNLFLLESPLNKKAQNLVPSSKAKFYQESKVPSTGELGYIIDNGSFTKGDIDRRTREISAFAIKRWAY